MEHNGFEYVDLGLPSGTLWATMNVGANSIYDGGLFFQRDDDFGFTKSHLLNLGGDSTKKPLKRPSSAYSIYRRDVWGNMIANEYMGKGWKIPTIEELTELIINVVDIKYNFANEDNGLLELVFQGSKKLVFPCCGFIANVSYGDSPISKNPYSSFLWYDGRSGGNEYFTITRSGIDTSNALQGVFLNIRCVYGA